MTFVSTGDKNDSIILFDRVLNDVADGEVFNITYPEDRGTLKVGKNGNSIFSRSAQGVKTSLILRLLKASPDDEFLNAKVTDQQNNPNFLSINGSTDKLFSDGKGNAKHEIFELEDGVFIKSPETLSDADGTNTDQAVAIYTMEFSSTERKLT